MQPHSWSGLKAPSQKQDKYDDDKNANDAYAAVTVAISIAAKATTEAPKQEDYQYYQKDGAKCHGKLLFKPMIILDRRTTFFGSLCGPAYLFSIEIPRSPMLMSIFVVFCRS